VNVNKAVAKIANLKDITKPAAKDILVAG